MNPVVEKTKNIFDRFYFLIPALIFAIIYFSSIFYGEAWEDDPFLNTPSMKNFNLVLKTFYDKTFFAGGVHYIPLYYFQAFCIHKIFGLNAYPFGFHLYEYLLQILVCIVSSFVVFCLTKNKLISVLVITFWTLHPINLQTFTRILCGVGFIAPLLFVLVFILGYLKLMDFKEGLGKNLVIVISNLFLLGSFLNAESSLITGLIIFYIYFCFQGKKILVKSNWHLLIPIFIVYPLYFLIRSLVSGGGDFVEPNNDLSVWTERGSIKEMLFRGLWLCPQLFVHYFKLFFYPFGLVDTAAEWYKVGNSLWSSYSLFCQVFIFSLIVFAIIFSRKYPLFSIGIVWFFLSFLLTIQIIPLFSIVALRYCYIPTLGLLLSIFSLFIYSPKINLKKSIFIFIPILIFLITKTVYYLPSSKNYLNQYIYRANEAPDWNKQTYIAKVIEEAKKNKQENLLPKGFSEDDLIQALENWIKKYSVINHDLSIKYGPMQMTYNFYAYRGILKYLYYFNRGSELNLILNNILKVKNDWMAWVEIGNFLALANRWDDAWKSYVNAISMNPNYGALYNIDFIEIAYRANKFDKAKEILDNYIKLKPNQSTPYFIMGHLMMKFNFNDEGIKYFKTAIDSSKRPDPKESFSYITAAKLFIQKNDLANARRSLQILLSYNPFNEEAKNILWSLK